MEQRTMWDWMRWKDEWMVEMRMKELEKVEKKWLV